MIYSTRPFVSTSQASEPSFYVERENTGFSLGSVGTVRQVAGFEGLVNSDTSRDLLIVGAGFEYELIAEVAEDKDDAKKLVLFGLPSLARICINKTYYRRTSRPTR